MRLQGVVTNVTNFGAFVDVGVHQDGLVHISELADNYVSNPLDVVKAGDVVHVNVLDVDLPRKRIALSMKQTSDAKTTGKKSAKPVNKKDHSPQRSHQHSKGQRNGKAEQQPLTAMAAALSQLQLKK
jgi:uncharacterized protein